MAPYVFQIRAPHRLGYVDLTTAAQEAVAAAGVTNGVLMAFCAHTTCALLLNEWEQGALDDLRAKLAELFPADAYYAHDDLDRRTENLVPDERKNGHAHVAAMFLGQTSQFIPIADGELFLGRWQRLFLVELDEPKERTVVMQALGHSAQSLVTNSQNASPAYRP